MLAAVLVTLPGLLLVERSLRHRLEEERISTIRSWLAGVVVQGQARMADAEARARRFADLVGGDVPAAGPGVLTRFDRIVGRDADGAWRSRREHFDAARDAAVFIPRTIEPDPSLKALLFHIKQVTAQFGAGTLDPTHSDAWVMPATGGEVIYVPDEPDYIRTEAADLDYRTTQWVRLVAPGVDSAGTPRWTEPMRSQYTPGWYASVVMPFQVGGRWAGSVGQDIYVSDLLNYDPRSADARAGEFYLFGADGSVYLADSSAAWGRPTALAGIPDPELRDTLRRLLATSSTAPSGEIRLTKTRDYYVLAVGIPKTSWMVADVVSEAEVYAPIRGTLVTARAGILLGLAGLGAISILAITREARRRRGIEEATRRSEERFIRLFQLSPDGVGVTRLEDGRLIEVNDSFVALCGYHRGEMLGRTTLELGLWGIPEQRDQVMGILQREGVVRNFPAMLRRKDGSLAELEFSGRIVEVGDEQCLLSILRDLEERRLLERQLTQAQRMEAIGRLAGGVAHDFNNIMTAVMGYAQIAFESLPESSPARGDLQEILRASSRASELTRQLLAFARHQVTQPRPVDTNGLVAETRKLLERLLGEDISLETRLGESLPPVVIDPGQLEQVLVNLAVNARDAMPAGGSLTLTTSLVGGEVVLEVADTGVGIARDHQPHIFEPFFTTKPLGKGTGLGLATCYGIVRQAGGRIEVASEPGRGARFTVTLPAASGAQRDAVAALSGTGSERAPQGSETILLAEDEPQVRELALRALTGLGYHVLAAVSGGEALELAPAAGGADRPSRDRRGHARALRPGACRSAPCQPAGTPGALHLRVRR